jgi:hypothetical protein
MGRRLLLCLALAAAGATALAHDPKSTAPRLSVRYDLGHGNALAIDFLSLHWNPRAYRNILASERMLRYKNESLFGALGSARFGVPVVIDGKRLAAGEYEFGFLLEADGSWKLRLKGPGGQVILPTRSAAASLRSDHLAVVLIPSPPDAVLLEVACGPHQTRHRIEVPFLTQHPEP